MSVFQKILFPVDMSDGSRNAAPFVDAMVKQFHSQLTLLHVLETPPSYFTSWYGFRSVVDMQAIRDGRINELGEFLADVFSGPMVSRVVVEGDPAATITEYARQKEFHLVVMPTHGFGLFREFLIGSVTAKVLHDCPAPVWTSIHLEEAAPAVPGFGDIMCAVDLEEKSIPVIQFASAIAGHCKSRLWLVHAIPGSEARPEKYFDTDLVEFLEAEARRTLTARLNALDVKAAICIGVGEVANVVRRSALEHKAGIVVAGRGHAARTLGRLRAHLYSIIQESPCPVISV